MVLGAAAGGMYGLYDGIRQTATADMKGRLRRTQITNYTLKSGATASNSLGSIAVIYSSLYCLLSFGKEILRPNLLTDGYKSTSTSFFFKTLLLPSTFIYHSC